jgi:hypothetical protein
VSSKTDTRLAVLKVLAGQSPDYYIFPNAAAFAAEGLDATEVAEVLDSLHVEGKIERELVHVIDHEDEVIVPGGYRLAGEEETT